jgi:ATP-dependent DNA helicase RecG
MSVIFEREEPLEAELSRVLAALAAGVQPPPERRVDLKEEAGRRRPDGSIVPGRTQNEAAAAKLAPEVACFANSAGGGALVVGVCDDGTLMGTDLDTEWLRARLYELLDRRLTVVAQAVRINDVHRLVVISVPTALEPVRWKGRLRHRVADRCVEVDATTWHAGRLHRLGYDWSAESSGRRAGEARVVAIERARSYLRQSGDAKAADLAAATQDDLLRRLNAVTPEGTLTRAGELVFVGRGEPAVDYIRRPRPGSDSVARRREGGLSLLEELHDVEQAVDIANEVVHLPSGFAVGRRRALPPRAVREAIVNGVAHRDWMSPHPTTVEHAGDTVTVTSPGGFPAGISPYNIITHPSLPRHRALTELLAALRVAEREGIGVDRMYVDMIRAGHPLPAYQETPEPGVRVVLLGGRPDTQWIRMLADVEPPDLEDDLNSLLIVHTAVDHGWVDESTAAIVLQRTGAEAKEALRSALVWAVDGEPLLVRVDGVPPGSMPAWRPGDALTERLTARCAVRSTREGRAQLAESWARGRGRVSSSELASLSRCTVREAGAILKSLRDDGVLLPSREGDPRGRGFHYLPASS